MRRIPVAVLLFLWSLIIPAEKVNAQIAIAEIIKTAVKKAIKAVDLKIQRLQNRTIWLQNAQKTIENKMSGLRLTEIGSWVEKQRFLYAEYFDELWKVKATLTSYQRTKDIILKQKQLVNEYKGAWALLRQTEYLNPEELDYIGEVYNGILEESLKNIDQLFLVINAFSTQMSDAKRMEIINSVDRKLNENLADLRTFNNQNKTISLQRASEKGEIETIKRLYGL